MSLESSENSSPAKPSPFKSKALSNAHKSMSVVQDLRESVNHILNSSQTMSCDMQELDESVNHLHDSSMMMSMDLEQCSGSMSLWKDSLSDLEHFRNGLTIEMLNVKN
jgi:conjugal transfer/entry exclusion protein